MRFSRARYVTLCQQSLVTAAVLAVAVSAAGVKTLDIVPQPGQTADLGAGVPGAQPRQALAQDTEPPVKTPVDVAPVTPKVREVRVSGVSAKGPKTARPTPPGARQAPPKAHEHEGAPSTEEPAEPKELVALSEPEPVRGYATVGVTWEHGTDYSDDQIDVTVRTEEDGKWSRWIPAEYHDEHGPDAGSAEEDAGRERPGTDALVVGDVDRVQMRAETTDGSTPPDLKLAVVDPGTGAMTREAPAIDTAKLETPQAKDESSAGGPQALSGPDTDPDAGSDAQDTVALSAMTTAPRPKIYTRSQWGANERLREQGSPRYGTVKAGFIHHTVNSNSYSSSQVPSLLRGIYAYHTQSRGWSDIGYNFLVDRFGRIWEGRYGGVTRAVVGAHTLGYNEYSFALSAIGNFDIKSPPTAVTSAYARLFAWKLSLYNIRADNLRVYVKNRYFRAISGHRDAGQTACPGRYLYAKLPAIRTAAQSIQNKAQTGSTITPFTSPTQTPLAAKAQPRTMTFPSTRNLSGAPYPDLALKDAAGRVSILPTGGQLRYSPRVSTSGNWHRMSLVSGVGDVTGDGIGDVVGRWPDQGRSLVYTGTGAGQVRTTGIAPTAAFRSAGSVVAAKDWDADGRNDVIMRTGANSRLWLVRGLGSGKFAAPRQFPDRHWAGYTSIAATGDLDRDGEPDLVGLNKNGHLYVIPGTKRGDLGSARNVRDVGTSYTGIVGSGDMSGDGIGDIAARDRTGAISILTGNGSGSFGDTFGKFFGPAGLLSVTGASMAGSAHSDLVGLDATRHKLVIFRHSGRTNLNARVPTNVTVPGASQVLTVGDWNRDGKHDLVTREGEGDRLWLRIGKGNGQYAAGTPMDDGWKPFKYLAAVGDVTGDKNPDLVGAKLAPGPFTVFPGNGEASFLAPFRAPSSLRTFNQIGTGSWAPASSRPTYISSDGSFVPVLGSLGADPAAYDWVVGPGDVDGDSRADLITRDSAGSLWLVPGKDKGFGARRLIGSGYGAYKLGG
jgi:N-acetylmuramoyl-L-alanine amidase/FG-GAP-like repeat